YVYSFFFFSYSAVVRDLPSFPTRRSSDLRFLCLGGFCLRLPWVREGGGGPTCNRARRLTSFEASKRLGFRRLLMGRNRLAADRPSATVPDPAYSPSAQFQQTSADVHTRVRS